MYYYSLFISIFLATTSCYVSAGEIVRVSPTTRQMVPSGKSMDAIDGDYIMKNDLVVAVIGDAVAGREANMRVQCVQGAVIDFTSLKDNNDYLAAFYPHGYPAEDSRRNPAKLADRIEIVEGSGSAIVLRATRKINDRYPYEM